MRTAKIFAILGTIIMFLTLAYGFIYGNFFKEGGVIISIAWGQVSLIDVYVGFFLFSGWVLFREQKKYIAVMWLVIFIILGNFATCLYATIALFNSNEDWKVFWLGRN